VTSERLGSYLSASNHDLERAFALYEWNMRASAPMLMTIGMVEVVVRNALDEQLRAWAVARHPGRSWLDAAPLDIKGKQDIAKATQLATRRVAHPAVHGKVIAELSIGFWRYLVASRYLTSLWIPATHAAFPNGATDLRTRRADVEHRLQQLTFVRNRAAHHEPIHRRNLDRDLAAAVELTGWVSRDCALWVAAKSTIDTVIQQRP
jgi:hypothetical protein